MTTFTIGGNLDPKRIVAVWVIVRKAWCGQHEFLYATLCGHRDQK